MGEVFKKEAVSRPDLPARTAEATTRGLVRVIDAFGREIFITKEQWRTSVLPRTLESHWNDPNQLYNTIIGSLKDGFAVEVIEAAEHLYRIDPVLARGACTYAMVLVRNNRLDEAELILNSYLDKYGKDGYVLTNLAKVYFARKEIEKTEITLWRALEVDPNQDNALLWYLSIQRERSGDSAVLETLHRVRALRGSWRAQLWLARTSLEANELGKALEYYRESLAVVAGKVPPELLAQMSGDLGKHGHPKELLALAEPPFDAKLHGIEVGNNLIKAHFDLGELNAARKVLDQLHAVEKVDHKQLLAFWDERLAKSGTQAIH